MLRSLESWRREILERTNKVISAPLVLVAGGRAGDDDGLERHHQQQERPLPSGEGLESERRDEQLAGRVLAALVLPGSFN